MRKAPVIPVLIDRGRGPCGPHCPGAGRGRAAGARSHLAHARRARCYPRNEAGARRDCRRGDGAQSRRSRRARSRPGPNSSSRRASPRRSARRRSRQASRSCLAPPMPATSWPGSTWASPISSSSPPRLRAVIAALKALAAPFGMAHFCPTGGITLANAPEWLALEAVLCVGGSWLVAKGPPDAAAIRAAAQAAAGLSACPP